MTNVDCLFLQQKRVVMKKRMKMKKSLMVIYKEMMLIADVIGMYKILNIYICKRKKKLMMLPFFVISLPIPPGAITSPFGFI